MTFSLDRTENPHPRMLAAALAFRGAARRSGDAIVGAYWQGYLAAMCDATGEPAGALNDWLDRHEEATRVVSSQPVDVRRT